MTTSTRKYLERTVLFSIFLILSYGACAPSGTRDLDELGATVPAETAYHVRRGDLLNVKVWQEPQLSGDVIVREDGHMTMPLLNDVYVDGKTLPKVSEEITSKLAQFVKDASVVVTVTQPAPIRYYLGGAFVKPGKYQSDSRITILQAIASGGGFAPFANEDGILLIRRIGNEEQRYLLNYNRILNGKQPNPELMDGDTVQVP